MVILWKTETTSLAFAELTVRYWKYQFFEIFDYHWLILFDDMQLVEQYLDYNTFRNILHGPVVIPFMQNN